MATVDPASASSAHAAAEPAAVAGLEQASRVHDRIAWTAYGLMVLALPFVVVLFRMHMVAWHYYLAGGFFMACALVICAMDFAGSSARDRALHALERAREPAHA